MVDVVSVRYCGPFGDYTGYGEANRNAIAALNDAGVKVTTERVIYTGSRLEYGDTYELANRLEGKPLDYRIKIIHTPSDGYLRYLEPTKYHIGHLFWETSSLSRTWVWNCNLMDEIWTGGEYHKECFRKAGVKVPIYVFPQAIDTNIPIERPFEIPGHKGYLFYSVFQWIERKNPRGLLEAYWDEFAGNDNVSLLIKTYGLNMEDKTFDKIRSEVAKWKKESNVKVFPRTFLYFELISKADMMRLHTTGDCFVSAHRGEGWGIPQVEAMLAGNPIISTNIGGVHEWLEDDKNAYLVDYLPVKVFNMEFAPWYDKGQIWAEPDKKELMAKMRFAYENPDKARDVGRAGQTFVKEKFSFGVVGEQMKDRLREIQRSLI